MKIVVIGAGFSGAYIARNLAEEGYKVKIIEKKNHIGGHCYDRVDKETGCLIHEYGPHIFHTNDDEIWEWLNKFSEFIPFELRTQVFFESYQDWFTCSFGFHTVEKLFDKNKAELIISALKSEFPNREVVTVPELLNANSSLIREFANILWEEDYLPYTAKQWGLKPEEVDQSIFKRVPVYMSYYDRYNKDKYEGLPKEGYTALFNAILDHKNIDIQLSVDGIKALEIQGECVYYEGEPAIVLFTGAIDELFNYEYGELRYRSLTFKNKVVPNDKEAKFGDPCVDVYPNHKYKFTRITNYGKLPIQNHLDYQISSEEYSHEFKVDSKMNRYYPTRTDKDLEIFEKYMSKAEKIKGLYFAGRLANYKYYNMDKALIAARKTFNKILKDINYNTMIRGGY